MPEASADRAAREAALDPAGSFIVQAPAGSGKTELLIQRYLKLLTTVREPEQVVAITFTRKAAAEMRNRVVNALRGAAAPEEQVEPRHAKTHELANAVLRHDARQGWSLLAQPQRLRIDTLDAFNAWLAQRLPILAGGVAGARIIETPEAQYRSAARRTLEELASDSATGRALCTLLPVLDNSLSGMERLLADLLPKREQWLRHLLGLDGDELRRQLEAGLARLIEDELAGIEALWPDDSLAELVPLLKHAAEHAERETTRQALRIWRELDALPAARVSALAAWRGIGALLLTSQGRWRRRFGRGEGYGPAHQAVKRQLDALLQRLADRDELADRLARIAALPEPRYSDIEWRDLTALKRVLTHLAAELRVVFAQQQAVDFVELGIAAQQALGQVERPSELLLALDQRIRHVMVDEFQDTSHSQVRLLELLTSGWEPGDGRSLFLVGDPMQSIYRFRDADVSLFLKVAARGLGCVRCTPITLQDNYRSAPAIVDWINEVFARVFPDDDTIDGGQIRFHPCRAMRDDASPGQVEIHAVRGGHDDNAEVATVVAILEKEQRADPDQSIALLVQSRSHLVGLHERLLAAGWPVHAVEIDAVADQQIGQDLIGLTRALSHLGDRVAWLAVLRAPWCGLTWDDLHRLCAGSPERTVWELINDRQRVERLSADGQSRLGVLRDVAHEAFRRRGLTSFSTWIERTWLQLDGPACLEHAKEHQTAERYFRRLEELTDRADLADPTLLDAAFSRAASDGEAPQGAGIEIMTIHRAKGLEFDTVVLFGLARELRRDETKALYWMERLRADGADDLLMAPLPREHAPLAEFLQRVDRQQEDAERARLLYVATTRARQRLHLVAQHGGEEGRPRGRSMLRLLWPQVAAAFAAPAPQPLEMAPCRGGQPRLRRLKDAFGHGTETAGWPAATGSRGVTAPLEFEWVGQAAVQIGTLVHRYLHRIADTGLASWDAPSLQGRAQRVRSELQLLGVEPRELDAATSRVIEILSRVLQHRIGRWALADRTHAQSELRVTVRTESGLEHLQLDRTFVDERNIRWIIDYKTSRHEGGDLDAFLDAEVARYRPQLESYAAAMAEIDPRPIRLGLYFPLLGAFRDWSYS